MDSGSVFKNLFENRFPLRGRVLMAYYDKSASTTKAFNISAIIDDVYKAFLDINCICSMAYENAEDYARVGHDHDNYTSAIYKVDTTNPNLTATMADIGNYGSIKNYTQTVDHSGEAEREYLKYAEKIGAVRFMCSTKTEADMSGWVLADGRTLDSSLYQFGSILRTYYGTSGNTIQIPNLDGFWKPFVNMTDGAQALTTITGQNCTVSHTHTTNIESATLQLAANSDITVTGNNYITSVNTGTPDTSYGTTHHGKYVNGGNFTRQATYKNTSFSTTLNSVGFLDTKDRPDNITQTYPSHQKIPAYIYIGPLA